MKPYSKNVLSRMSKKELIETIRFLEDEIKDLEGMNKNQYEMLSEYEKKENICIKCGKTNAEGIRFNKYSTSICLDCFTKEILLPLMKEYIEKKSFIRWHSVKDDGNPKKNHVYHVTFDDGTLGFSSLLLNAATQKWQWMSEYTSGKKVIAWMPMPKTYKED